MYKNMKSKLHLLEVSEETYLVFKTMYLLHGLLVHGLRVNKNKIIDLVFGRIGKQDRDPSSMPGQTNYFQCNNESCDCLFVCLFLFRCLLITTFS